jgi:hypothetical protein
MVVITIRRFVDVRRGRSPELRLSAILYTCADVGGRWIAAGERIHLRFFVAAMDGEGVPIERELGCDDERRGGRDGTGVESPNAPDRRFRFTRLRAGRWC